MDKQKRCVCRIFPASIMFSDGHGHKRLRAVAILREHAFYDSELLNGFAGFTLHVFLLRFAQLHLHDTEYDLNNETSCFHIPNHIWQHHSFCLADFLRSVVLQLPKRVLSSCHRVGKVDTVNPLDEELPHVDRRFKQTLAPSKFALIDCLVSKFFNRPYPCLRRNSSSSRANTS